MRRRCRGASERIGTHDQRFVRTGLAGPVMARRQESRRGSLLPVCCTATSSCKPPASSVTWHADGAPLDARITGSSAFAPAEASFVREPPPEAVLADDAN